MAKLTSCQFTVLAIAFLEVNPGYAAFKDCNVSGQPGVIQSNPLNAVQANQADDILWKVKYDEDREYIQVIYEDFSAPTSARAQAVSNVICTSPVVFSSDGNNLDLSGCGIIFNKTPGSPIFTRGQFRNNQGIGTGSLADPNRDGVADELDLVLDFSHDNTIPKGLMNVPLQYSTQGGQAFWVLPRLLTWSAPGIPSQTVDIKSSYFTPVNAQKQTVYVDCSAAGGPIVTSGINIGGGGGANPIPTTSFWGYAVMILLITFAASWRLSRGGFSDDFNLRF